MAYLGNTPAVAYSAIDYQDLTGGTGTSFTLDNAVASANEIEVYVNNVRQEPSVAYTTSGTALTMTASIGGSDDFYIVYQGKAQQTTSTPAASLTGALPAIDGSALTSLTAANLTGTLPAIDGSALTGIAAGATGGGSDEIFYENGQTVTTNYTITDGKNAMSAGPITINTGVTVTVGTGETWTVV